MAGSVNMKYYLLFILVCWSAALACMGREDATAIQKKNPGTFSIDALLIDLSSVDRDDLFCTMRKAIRERDVSTIDKLLAKESEETLRSVLLDVNSEGHKPLLEIAHEHSKRTSICAKSTKIGRAAIAVVFIGLNFLDAYINKIELASSRKCPAVTTVPSAQLAIIFATGYFICTIFYGFMQVVAIVNKYDDERILNDSLRIYKKIQSRQEKLARTEVILPVD